jgi:PTS system nitrogen regulatory IIA component
MNTADNSGQIMTLGEVAAYLKLAQKTVLRLVHRGEIPCFKVASQWRFLRTVIDDWMLDRIQSLPSSGLARMIENEQPGIPVSRLLRPELIRLDIAPADKEAVLSQLIEPLVHARIVTEAESFVHRLLERERMVSTGVGRGVALPHLRRPRENPSGGPYLVLGICRQGTDFQALDGGKSHLFALLCADSEVVHLRIMAALALLLRRGELVEALVAAQDSREVINMIIREDQQQLFSPESEPGAQAGTASQ